MYKINETRNSITLQVDRQNVEKTFKLLKFFLNADEFIPFSVYAVTEGGSGEIIKTKKSISRLKNISIYEFLDDLELEIKSITYRSGESSGVDVAEWEIRYKLQLDSGAIHQLTLETL